MRWTRAVGWAATAVGIGAWAAALTLLPPALPAVAGAAVGPGGDGELFMWVAELRWSGILLAALGLLVALAPRTAAPRASAVLAGLLLVADSVFWQHGSTGTEPLLLALLTGAAATAVAGRLAGAAGDEPGDARVTVAAIGAACCGPLLFVQGSSLVDRASLPTVLTVLMAVLPAAYAAFAVAAVGKPPLLAVAVPVAALGMLTTAATRPFDPFIGFVLAGPLTALVVALTRPRRSGPARWSAIAAIAVLLPPAVFAVGFIASGLAAGPLFVIAGDNYPVDGVSLVPGVALLALPIAVAVQRRSVRRDLQPAG